MRGMRLKARDNYQCRATFERQTQTEEGLRYVQYIANWPCAVEDITTENQFRDAFEGATKVLVGPIYPHKRIRADDRLVSLSRANGRQDVITGKAWPVVGQRDQAGLGDAEVQLVFLRQIK